MSKNKYDMGDIDISWCPGCGNYSILKTLMETLEDLGLQPENTVLVSGIGQAAKTPQYLNCNYFNGLHGRALPAATAIKASNPELTVIAESGDGDMYGEGGNHFMHTIRRNPNITNVVHNNMVYGLTKGQASPTSQTGFVTPVQVHGVIMEPFNPLAVAIALEASFVARAYSGNREQTRNTLRQAIEHKGYSLVDILQPCVTFNKANTYEWFEQNTYYLEENHDPEDRTAAFIKATEKGKLGLGVFYMSPDRIPFEERIPAYIKDRTPLHSRDVNEGKLAQVINSRK